MTLIRKVNLLWAVLALLLLTVACGNSKTGKSSADRKAKKVVNVPSFSADSAYNYIQTQVDFGPRVPNTEEHENCAQYLIAKLKEYGADVIVQEGQVVAFDKTKLNIKNIIAQYKPELNNRILLFAHWDTRPFADNDPNEAEQHKPILGANDGASGVGVLLEVARQFNIEKPQIGVDIILFDAEDYGVPSFENENYTQDTWCLGTQYWGKNLHKKGYYAQYGILLDMVGAPNATFYQEQFSMSTAKRVVNKVWGAANDLGYGSHFVYDKGGYITDDHVYVNKYTNIPCVDIIQYDPTSSSSFGEYWHTHNDNMDVISKETLKAVGQTLLQVVYSEQ